MGKSNSTDWATIKELLPPCWRTRAAELKLVKPNLPKHLNAKVKDIEDILRLVLYQVALSTSLETATAAFAAAGMLSLSFVALHFWMKKLGPYLGELTAAMVGDVYAAWAPQRWAGFEICITDATTVQRPGAKGTTARVHRALRLPDLRVIGVLVTNNKVGETFRNFAIKALQLWIGDRAYANPPGIAWVVSHGAQVLVRFNRGSLPLYDGRGQRIDVLDRLVKRLRKPLQSEEWQAFVHIEGGDRIQGRLCAVRLPPNKAAQARERVHKELGKEATPESFAMADFVVVFTTVSKDLLDIHQILELYRLRWQIELDFKRDKSVTGLDKLPNYLPETIESWIYAKLLLHQITRKLADRGSAFPPQPSPAPSVPPSSNAQPNTASNPSADDAVRGVFEQRPWNILTTIFSLLPGALLPVPLSTIRDFVHRFLRHILRANPKKRPRQIERMQFDVLGLPEAA